MISNKQVGLTLLTLYVLAAVAYGATLELTSAWDAEDVPTRVTIDYVLKALVTVPLAWFVFGLMRARSETEQLVVTALLALPFAFAWQSCYYAVCDLLGVGHMGDAGGWWDIYIPTLFYCIQFLILFAAQYHNRTMAALQRAEALDSLAQASELSALKAQVNPHFLFNTFNAISAGLPPEQEATRETLAQLADLFRYQVVASQSDTVPLAKELDFLDDYLSLCRLRMGPRLQYRIDVDSGLRQTCFIAPMLLQPLVENAVSHGLSPKLEGGFLRIVIKRVGESERFTVSDDGVGFALGASTSSGTGVGFANTRRRLQLKYASELEVKSDASGTEISFGIQSKLLERAVNHSPAPAVSDLFSPQLSGV